MSSSASDTLAAADPGPAGLGVMASLSPACTPLKHRYDKCFNLWLEDYLNVSPPPRVEGGAPTVPAPVSASASASAGEGAGERQAASKKGGWGGWFSSSSSAPSSSSSSQASSSSASTSSSSSSSASSPFSASSSTPPTARQPATSAERERLRNRLEGECGALFREYQACVKRAVQEKQLSSLIVDARAYNPFPFPRDRKEANGEPNSEPFPFPAAKRAESDEI